MKRGKKLELMIKEKFPAWSLNRFADYAGIKRTTMYDITKKETLDKVSVENIIIIAKGLGMSIEELIFRLDKDIQVSKRIEYKEYKEEEENEKYQIFLKESEQQSMLNLNFYGQVLAGQPECIDSLEHAEQIKLPKLFLGKYADRKDVFVMKINGDSMNKILPANSLILCVQINSIDELKTRDIVIFSYNNEISVKRFRETESEVIFSPESTNENHFDKVISKTTLSELKIIAKVISYHVVLD